ncbi:hypothetical protein JL720_13649 [Aureococcus anophagefferens]|nr:hypothetical protein JL720_13649 [Aureococcus anophagefferens]
MREERVVGLARYVKRKHAAACQRSGRGAERRDGGPDPARVFNPRGGTTSRSSSPWPGLDSEGRTPSSSAAWRRRRSGLGGGALGKRRGRRALRGRRRGARGEEAKPAAAARVPKELLVDPLDRDALKANFTAPALKATAEDLGLAKSGTKDAIINRIAQFLADGGQVPP